MKRSVSLTLTWGRIATAIASFALIGAIGALLFAWSGIYSIAASRGHPAFFESFLEFGMRRSVAMNAEAPAPPDLGDPGRIALGAAHYRAGCAPCHGAPADEPSPITRAMLPVPPLLAPLVDDWSDEELHWIVTHGIQYSGMPGWAGEDRPAEVWSVVAFLRVLPELDAEDYDRLSLGNIDPTVGTTSEIVNGTGPALSLTTCAGCHAGESSGPVSADVPLLANQSAEYLESALLAYRSGTRESGMMEPVAVALDPERIRQLARFYADLPDTTHPAAGSQDQSSRLRGRQIAIEGLPRHDIPSCNSCHDGSARDSYPRLTGQSARYIQIQLEVWQRGGRSGEGQARTMASIAGRLSPEQIEAVAAYYASLGPGETRPGARGGDQ